MRRHFQHVRADHHDNHYSSLGHHFDHLEGSLRSRHSFSRGRYGRHGWGDYYDTGGWDFGGDAWGWDWWDPLPPYAAAGFGVGITSSRRSPDFYSWYGFGYTPWY